MPATLPLSAASTIGASVGSPAEMGEMMGVEHQGTLLALPLSTGPMAEVSVAQQDLRSVAIRSRVELQP